MFKKYILFLLSAMCSFILFGCSCGSSSNESSEDSASKTLVLDQAAVEQEAKALQTSLQPAQSNVIKPQATGKNVEENQYAKVDYSNASDGYVMVQFTAASDKKLKSQVVGPSTTYTYNLTQGEWAVFPYLTEMVTIRSKSMKTSRVPVMYRFSLPMLRCFWKMNLLLSSVLINM